MTFIPIVSGRVTPAPVKPPVYVLRGESGGNPFMIVGLTPSVLKKAGWKKGDRIAFAIGQDGNKGKLRLQSRPGGKQGETYAIAGNGRVLHVKLTVKDGFLNQLFEAGKKRIVFDNGQIVVDDNDNGSITLNVAAGTQLDK